MMDWTDLYARANSNACRNFSQLLTRANEPELKSRAGSAYRVVKQRKTGAPDTIRTCDLCLRRATLIPRAQYGPTLSQSLPGVNHAAVVRQAYSAARHLHD